MKRGLWLFFVAFALSFCALTTAAQAQATRTWVSGVGDDANPCSRTAPCKTFAGAISKTAECGEIDALDPAGYGAVTITKGITIDGGGGDAGQVASILASGITGVIINISSVTCQKVILRNLDVNGANTGVSGVSVLAAQAVSIENTSIYGFTQYAINLQPTAHAKLTVSHSNIENNATGGIISSTTSGINRVNVQNTTIQKSAVGITVGANTDLDLFESVVVQSSTGAILANQPTAFATLSSSQIGNGQGFGVHSTNSAIVRMTNCTVSFVNGTGLLADAAGQIVTWSNNYVAGNTADGARTSTITPM